MNFKELTAWVEANPGKSVLIGGGLVIFLLWIFGAFSKGQASDGGSSLAAAYYAAEAQQAVVGGQIQMATINAAAQTAQSKIGADAAVTINAQQGSVVSHLGDLNLQVTQSNNATLLSGLQSNNATSLSLASDALAASQFHDLIASGLPMFSLEAAGGGSGYSVSGLGAGGTPTFGVQQGNLNSPNYFLGLGYSPADAYKLAIPTPPSVR